MKSNALDVAMNIAVFELLVANPADADYFCTTSTDKGAPEKLVNDAVACLDWTWRMPLPYNGRMWIRCCTQSFLELNDRIHRLLSIAVWVRFHSSRTLLIHENLSKYIGFREEGLFKLQPMDLISFWYTASIF